MREAWPGATRRSRVRQGGGQDVGQKALPPSVGIGRKAPETARTRAQQQLGRTNEVRGREAAKRLRHKARPEDKRPGGDRPALVAFPPCVRSFLVFRPTRQQAGQALDRRPSRGGCGFSRECGVHEAAEAAAATAEAGEGGGGRGGGGVVSVEECRRRVGLFGRREAGLPVMATVLPLVAAPDVGYYCGPVLVGWRAGCGRHASQALHAKSR